MITGTQLGLALDVLTVLSCDPDCSNASHNPRTLPIEQCQCLVAQRLGGDMGKIESHLENIAERLAEFFTPLVRANAVAIAGTTLDIALVVEYLAQEFACDAGALRRFFGLFASDEVTEITLHAA